jgi:hypothetical protein
MTHEQIDRVVRRANPVPDPNALASVAGPVLTTLLERRMEMQVDQRTGTEVQSDRNRWRGPLIGIAVAALILVAGLVFMLTRDDTPVAEPAPNATQMPAEDIDAPLPPGAYYIDTDGDQASSLRGTFVIEGDGWTSVPSGARKNVGDDFVALMVAEVDQVWSPVCETPDPMAASKTAAGLANQIATNGFTVREALAPVTAFGYEGQHVVLEVPDGCAGSDHSVWEGPVFGRYYVPSGRIVEYWFLDVEGTPVMVEADWNPAASPEEDVAEVRTILDTLVITP